jgi:hypothetical protein
LLQAKKRPGDGDDTLESSEQNYVDVSKYSPPDISKYTSHEMEELLLSKVSETVPVLKSWKRHSILDWIELFRMNRAGG